MKTQRPAVAFTESEIREENEKIQLLRGLIDFSLRLIARSSMSAGEAQQIVRWVRLQAVRLFPDKEEAFELLYTPRFRRLIAEKYSLL